MSKELTNKQKQDYIKSKGSICPFCGSEMLEGNEIDVIDGQANQEMQCLDCGEVWTDIYQLVDISQ